MLKMIKGDLDYLRKTHDTFETRMADQIEEVKDEQNERFEKISKSLKAKQGGFFRSFWAALAIITTLFLFMVLVLFNGMNKDVDALDDTCTNVKKELGQLKFDVGATGGTLNEMFPGHASFKQLEQNNLIYRGAKPKKENIVDVIIEDEEINERINLTQNGDSD